MKKITTAAVAASMLGGIAIGSFVAPTMSAFADSSAPATANITTQDPTSPDQWITDSLKGLVDKGTITQSQSDTIATTLEGAEPKDMHFVLRGGPDMPEIAKILGMSESDLRTATQTKSLADIAKDKNVDVQKVIDALVSSEDSRIDQAVKDGKVTQSEADQRKNDVKQHVTDMVNKVHISKPQLDGDGPMPSQSDMTTSPAPMPAA